MYGNVHYLERPQPYNLSLAYCFWALGLVGLFGAHRVYVGHYCLGILYFCTMGLFGVGWLIDLCLLPEIVREANEAYLLEAPLLPSTYQAIPVSYDGHSHHHGHGPNGDHMHYIPVAVPCPAAPPPCPHPHQPILYPQQQPAGYQQLYPQVPPPFPAAVPQPGAPQPPAQNPYYRPGS